MHIINYYVFSSSIYTIILNSLACWVSCRQLLIYDTTNQLNVWFSVQWVRNRKGKQLALIAGFTFYNNGWSKTTDYWRCCKSPCKARFTTTKDKHVKRMSLAHSHPPVKFTLIKELYVKLWIRFCLCRIISYKIISCYYHGFVHINMYLLSLEGF